MPPLEKPWSWDASLLGSVGMPRGEPLFCIAHRCGQRPFLELRSLLLASPPFHVKTDDRGNIQSRPSLPDCIVPFRRVDGEAILDSA